MLSRNANVAVKMSHLHTKRNCQVVLARKFWMLDYKSNSFANSGLTSAVAMDGEQPLRLYQGQKSKAKKEALANEVKAFPAVEAEQFQTK